MGLECRNQVVAYTPVVDSNVDHAPAAALYLEPACNPHLLAAVGAAAYRVVAGEAHAPPVPVGALVMGSRVMSMAEALALDTASALDMAPAVD